MSAVVVVAYRDRHFPHGIELESFKGKSPLDAAQAFAAEMDEEAVYDETAQEIIEMSSYETFHDWVTERPGDMSFKFTRTLLEVVDEVAGMLYGSECKVEIVNLET